MSSTRNSVWGFGWRLMLALGFAPQEASKLFAKAVEADPADDRTWLQWALLERRRRKWEDSLK